MNTGQRALIRAARKCASEAARADRLGQRRYAGLLRAAARRALAAAAAEGSEPLIKAIASVHKAGDLAGGLPDRDTDAAGHDECVKAVRFMAHTKREELSGAASQSRRAAENRGAGAAADRGPRGLPVHPELMTMWRMTRSVAIPTC
jgi:hypothetical protein